MKLHQSLKNFLPEDTRIAELTSAISACFSLLFLYYSGSFNIFDLLMGTLGVIQLYSLIFLDKIQSLRVYLSLLIGGLLVYSGIATAGSCSECGILKIILGIANIYAFLVNNQRLK